MARIVIDTTGEIYGSTATIADLAQYTPILSLDSDCLNIYEVEEATSAEWKWEIDTWNLAILALAAATFSMKAIQGRG